MRMVGPNCMGLLNASAPSPAERVVLADLAAGRAASALSSQSGALGLAILELARRAAGRAVHVRQRRQQGRRVGQRPAAVPGKRIRRRSSSCCISSRSGTRGDSRGWRGASRARSRSSRVKAGRTRAGSRAAGSHTAALAASDVAVDALFRQSGVIRADTIDEMFDIAACLDAQPLPAGRRVAIVTNAGRPGHSGRGCLRSGRADRRRRSAPRHARALAALLPAVASVGNPVDMVASAGPDEYRRADRSRAHRRRHRRAHRHLHAGGCRACSARCWTAIRDGIAAGRGRRRAAQTDAGVPDGRGRAGRSRSIVGGETHARRMRFRRTPPARSAKSPPMPSGARNRPVSSGASRTSAPTTPGTSCRAALDARRRTLADRRRDPDACSSAFGLPLAAGARRAHGGRSGGAGARCSDFRSRPSCRARRAAQDRRRRRPPEPADEAAVRRAFAEIAGARGKLVAVEQSTACSSSR